MNDLHLVLHGLAIKKYATPEAIAGIVGLDPARVGSLLGDLVGRGQVAETKGQFMLTPLARMALDGEYSRFYGDVRSSADFVAGYDAFEQVNVALKSLITDWQTIEIGGARVTNDHANKEHDRRIIDRLGDLHERADRIFARLAAHLPRLQIYRDKLLAALEKAEDGDIEWVSGARIESYHTVWFELHEDLLRILGRERTE